MLYFIYTNLSVVCLIQDSMILDQLWSTLAHSALNVWMFLDEDSEPEAEEEESSADDDKVS